jgi:hypothetical protein
MPTIFMATIKWYNPIEEKEQQDTVTFLANDFVDATNTLVKAFAYDIREILDFTPIGQGYVISLGHSDKVDEAIELILKENDCDV